MGFSRHRVVAWVGIDETWTRWNPFLSGFVKERGVRGSEEYSGPSARHRQLINNNAAADPAQGPEANVIQYLLTHV